MSYNIGKVGGNSMADLEALYSAASSGEAAPAAAPIAETEEPKERKRTFKEKIAETWNSGAKGILKIVGIGALALAVLATAVTGVCHVVQRIREDSSQIAQTEDQLGKTESELGDAISIIEEEATKYHNTVAGIVNGARDSIDSANDRYDRLYSQVSGVSDEITVTIDGNSMSAIEALEDLKEQEGAITEAETTYGEMVSYNGQDSLTQLEEAYSAKDYKTVNTIGQYINEKNSTITSELASAGTVMTEVQTAYNEYMAEKNDELANTVINVEFTEADLNNTTMMQYLTSPSLAGKVLSIDQCTYNRTNGEVSILASCTDLFGRAYTNLITSTIAPGLTQAELSASNLITRVQNAESANYQVFNNDMIGLEGSGVMNNGGEEVSGDISAQYSVTAVYNAKTGKTTITAQAIVVVKGADGKVISHKVYTAPTATRNGVVKENDVKAEFEAKLAGMIEADNTLQIDAEAENA